jgi:hypothetical protein
MFFEALLSSFLHTTLAGLDRSSLSIIERRLAVHAIELHTVHRTNSIHFDKIVLEFFDSSPVIEQQDVPSRFTNTHIPWNLRWETVNLS